MIQIAPAAVRADWSARVFSEMQTRAALYEALKRLRRAMNFRDAALCSGEPAALQAAVQQINEADEIARAALAKAEPR